MKLIKTSSFIIILCSLVSWQSFASDPDGIKLNNVAVELLEDALKARQKAQSQKMKGTAGGSQPDVDKMEKDLNKIIDLKNQSTFEKLWTLIFGGISEEQEPVAEANQEDKSETKDVKPGEFLTGQDEKEKEENGQNVDEDLVFEAHKKFIQATMKSGELPEVRMNLGLSFELSGEVENSFKAYNMAELAAKGNPSLEFIARYNKARILAAQKKIPLALKEYQSALELNPESLEVKTNIELLIQQQQGGGKGGEGEKKEKEGEDGKDPKDGPIKKNPKNSEYKSQNLSKKDVEKILEELKSQEQNIREKEYNKGVKEKSRNKDW